MRDSQRKRVYDAESICHPALAVESLSLDELQRIARRVTASRWWAQLLLGPTAWKRLTQPTYGPVSLWANPVRGRGGRCARVTVRAVPIVHMPRWSRCRLVLAHELAHVLTMAQSSVGVLAFAAHGPEFAWNFLQLVRHLLGQAAYHELRRQMREHKVRVRRPRIDSS